MSVYYCPSDKRFLSKHSLLHSLTMLHTEQKILRLPYIFTFLSTKENQFFSIPRTVIRFYHKIIALSGKITEPLPMTKISVLLGTCGEILPWVKFSVLLNHLLFLILSAFIRKIKN